MNIKVPSMPQEDHIVTKASEKENKSEDGEKFHRCYQQNLLQVIQSLIRCKDTNNEVLNNEKYREINSICAIQVVPLLIEGFLQNMSEWGENSKKSKANSKKNKKITTTSSHSDSVTRIQLRFCFFVLHPMIERVRDFAQFRAVDTSSRISSNETKDARIFFSLIRSIKSSVSLILKYGAYLPSHNDLGDCHIRYLTMIGETVLNLLEGDNSMFCHSFCDESAKAESLLILRDLFNLNHHIFHKKN